MQIDMPSCRTMSGFRHAVNFILRTQQRKLDLHTGAVPDRLLELDVGCRRNEALLGNLSEANARAHEVEVVVERLVRNTIRLPLVPRRCVPAKIRS